jgi:hypothetical protein
VAFSGVRVITAGASFIWAAKMRVVVVTTTRPGKARARVNMRLVLPPPPTKATKAEG